MANEKQDESISTPYKLDGDRTVFTEGAAQQIEDAISYLEYVAYGTKDEMSSVSDLVALELAQDCIATITNKIKGTK